MAREMRLGIVRASVPNVSLPRWLALVALATTCACSAAETEADDDSAGRSPATVSGTPNAGTNAGGHDHGTGSGTGTGNGAGTNTTGDGTNAPGEVTNLGPKCDEDNPVTTSSTDGSTDKLIPEPIIQYERRLNWGCIHRQYHDTRQWDWIINDPKQADRVAYMKKMNWTRATILEGSPTSGLDFLAMHRAMLGTLKSRFPEQADLFKGWTAVPTEATAADPVPPSSVSGTFWASMVTAIARLENDVGSFATEDELGLFIDTQHRPTAEDPLARSTEKGTGVHTYLHVRFDDAKSPVRMQRFSRNLESQVFWRVHGWVDRIWSKWRTAKGRDDKTDSAYAAAMHHACMHMGLMNWDVAKTTCTP
jgi:hypothetical protein